MFVAALVQNSSACQVRLAWDANTEADLAGYRIYYGTQPDQLTESVDAGAVTEGAVDALETGTIYYFAVTAYNRAGFESAPSNPISYRTPQTFSRQTFSGVFGEGPGGSGGFFLAKLGPGGAASGRIGIEGKAYSWRGVFDRNGQLTLTIADRERNPVAVLNLQLAQDSRAIRGTVQTPEGSSQVEVRAATSTKADPRAGRYTVALKEAEPESNHGHGYGVLMVSKRGVASIAGVYPGGERLLGAAGIDSADAVPIYRFHRRLGSQAGRITFRDVADASDADGEIWLRNGKSEESRIEVSVARYTAWNSGANTAITPSFSIAISHSLYGSIYADVMGRRALLGRAPGEILVDLRISAGTGLFTGRCSAPDSVRFSYSGALYQKGPIAGFGRVAGGLGSVGLQRHSP